MPPATICDELISLLEAQRNADAPPVWLSPENMAWLSRPAPVQPHRTASLHVLPAAAPHQTGTMRAPQEAVAAPQRTASFRPQPPPAPSATPTFRPLPAASAAPIAPIAPIAPAPSPLQDLGSLNLPQLRDLVAACRRCGLCGSRQQTVFGSGNPDAELMFIGEGPGADEDREGVPFIGAAGELLTKIITAGMGLKREAVYITNIVKCRPPMNRNPEQVEAEACLPYLQRQIELVRPKVIITLGAVPLQHLLGKSGISKMRGQWLDYRGIPVMPTFHPSYLLRVPAAKRDTWQDVQAVMARLGIQSTERR